MTRIKTYEVDNGYPVHVERIDQAGHPRLNFLVSREEDFEYPVVLAYLNSWITLWTSAHQHGRL